LEARVGIERASVLQAKEEPLESIASSVQNPNFRHYQAQI
jgi:hypothetical protein